MIARLAIVVAAFGTAVASANDYFRDNYRDPRWLGRGNAAIASVSDGTSLFYNPAGLGFNQKVGLEFINPWFGANQNIVTSFSQLRGVSSGNQTLTEKFAPFLGDPLGGQGGIFPHFFMPGFAIGYWDYLDGQIEYRNPVNPELNLDARNDHGFIAGGALSYKNLVMMGMSVRYQRRRHLYKQLDSSTVFGGTTALLKDLQAKGDAFGVNLGLQVRKDWSVSTAAFGLTLDDLGVTSFRNQTGGEAPPRQAQSLNAGVSYGLKTRFGGASFHFDYKHMLDSEIDLTKKLFFGAEVNLPLVDVRAGMFQGYWTAGVAVAIMPFVELQAVSYGEELGSAAGLRPNRFYLLGLRIGADLEKKKGKTKQRYTLDKY